MTLNYPFAVISDIHCHDWSTFSSINSDKINSRLQETLDAIEEAVLALIRADGNDLVITGDLFHTRGKTKPSVYNPVFNFFKELCEEHLIRVWCIPGNHDLEGKESYWVENTIHALGAIDNFNLFTEVTEIGNYVFIPWIEHKDDFVEIINNITNPKGKTVFCHIGIDGVLDGVAGKVGKAVLDRGFRNVFSGDYHNHKALGNGIYSVGALTHHSFGDIGSKAGFLIVRRDGVEQYETKAPKFLNGETDHSEIIKSVFEGNIVRLQGVMSEENAESLVKSHLSAGAKFVSDLTTRPTIKETSMSTAPVRVDLTIDEAIESYVKNKYGVNYADVLKEAKRIKDEHV